MHQSKLSLPVRVAVTLQLKCQKLQSRQCCALPSLRVWSSSDVQRRMGMSQLCCDNIITPLPAC
jgi:hypothetical protein